MSLRKMQKEIEREQLGLSYTSPYTHKRSQNIHNYSVYALIMFPHVTILKYTNFQKLCTSAKEFTVSKPLQIL